MTDEKHHAEQRDPLLPLAASELPAHRRNNEKSGVEAHDIDLVVGLEEMQRRHRRQQRGRRFLQLLLVTLVAGAFVTHWARSGSGAAAQSEHGRHGHDGPFPWFPSPPPHRGGKGHGPPPPPPHGPPHHRPLQCWSLPEGDSVNISLPLMSSPPPPPPPGHGGPHGGHKHDKQHDAASASLSWRKLLDPAQWGRGKHHGHGHRHGHGPRHGPPPPPTVWLHHSLLSSEVSIVRDDLGRPGPDGPDGPPPPPPGHHEPPHDDKDKDSDGVASEKPRPPHPPPPPPHHPMIVMATFSRAPVKDNDEKREGGEHDDEPSGPKKLDVCTFAAPHGVSVGVFRPPPKHDEGDGKELAGPDHPPKDGPPPPPPHHRRPFPPFPKDQYKEVSAVLHLPQGEPIFLGTVPPPPPPPPHHGHKGGKKEGCHGGAM